MGEIADMMIDGTMCPCGQFIDDGADGPGYPQYCSPECKSDYGGPDEPLDVLNRDGAKDPRTIQCPVEGCERMFRNAQAIGQHVAAKHY